MVTEKEILELVPDLERIYKVGACYVDFERRPIGGMLPFGDVRRAVEDAIRYIKEGKEVFVALGRSWIEWRKLEIPKFCFVADDLDELYEFLLIAATEEEE